MSKNYLRAVYNLRQVMNDDRYSDDEKRRYIQQARQSIQDNGIQRSSGFVRAKDNLNSLMHNDNYSDDQKRQYILQAMGRLSENGNVYDVFKEPEEHYSNPYVDRMRVRNPNYNPLMPGINGMPKNEYNYDAKVEQAQKASNALARSGIEIPKPDEEIKKDESNKGGILTRIFNTMASPFFAMNKGIKNAVDDDDKTSFLKGVKEGLVNTFWSNEKHNDSMVGAKEVMQTLRHSDNDIKRSLGDGMASTVGAFKYGIKYAQKVKENPAFAKDFKAQEELYKQCLDNSEGSSGFLIDMLEPNPLGIVKGLGSGAKLLSKGSGALNVSKEIGGIDKAHDILKSVLPEVSRKDAEYFLRKTSKMLGSMEDYKGIRLGTENHNLQVMSPETIAKIGDYTIAPGLNKVRDIMSNSNISKTLGRMFSNETKQIVRADRSRALENSAFKMKEQIAENIKNMNKKAHLDKAQAIEKEIASKSKDKDMPSIITDAIENKQDIYKSENITKTTTNPHYAMELESERAKRYEQLVKDRIELENIKNNTNGSVELNQKINEIDEELKYLDSLGELKHNYMGKENVDYDRLQSGYYQSEGNNLTDKIDFKGDKILDEEKTTKDMLRQNKLADEQSKIKNIVDKIEKDNTSSIPKMTNKLAEKEDNVTPLNKIIEEKKNPIEKLYTPQEEAALEQIKGQQKFDLDKLLGKEPTKDLGAMESTLGKVEEEVPKVADEVKQAIQRPKDVQDVIDRVHTIDEKLGKEPTKFVDDLTLEQANNALKRRTNEAVKSGHDLSELESKIVNKDEIYQNAKNIDSIHGTTYNVEHSIPEANGITPTQKRLLVQEMKKVKEILPEDFKDLRFTKQFGVMNHGDYVNEMNRLKEIKRIYAETEGTNISKIRRVQDYIIDTNGQRILDNITKKKTDILKTPSKEQFAKVDELLKDSNEIEKTFAKANEKIGEDVRKHEIPEDKLEDLMLDKTAPIKENMVDSLKELKRKAYAIQLHDKAWGEEVLKNIDNKVYDTTDKIRNAIKSIDEHFEQIPLSESKGSKQLLKIFNNEDYSAFKRLKLTEGKTSMRIYNYNGVKVGIDKNVQPEKVKELFRTLEDLPVDAKKVLSNTNQLNYINSFLENNALGKASGNSRNITLTSRANKELTQHILSHELSHINLTHPEDKGTLLKTIRHEFDSLSKGEMKEIKEVMKEHGIETAKDFGTYITSHAEKANKQSEFLADISAMYFNGSPKLRETMNKTMPLTGECISKIADKFSSISKDLPETSKYKELTQQMEHYKMLKNYISKGDFTELDNKITELATNRTIEQMEKVLKDYTPKEPKEFAQIVHKISKEKEIIDSRVVEAGLVDLMKGVSKDFSKWGKKEEITEMSNYVTHMLNSSLQTPKGQRTLKKLQQTGVISSPKNMFNLKRQYAGTIKEINEAMKKKTGIDNFFETNITKIYLNRAFKHEDIMHRKNRFNDFMNLFSEKLDHERLLKMDTIERNKMLSEMQNKIASGEYTVIQKTENFIKKPGASNTTVVKNINGKLFSKATSEQLMENTLENIGHHVDNPYIEVNTKRLQDSDLFNGSNDLYLVPKKSLEMYEAASKADLKENTNALLKAYDKFTGLWKAMAVTSGTFHVNNAVGNLFNSYLEIGANILSPGLNHTARQIQGLSLGKKIKGSFMGKPNTYWAREAEKYGVIGDGFFSTSANSFINGKAKKLNHENPIAKLNPLSTNNVIFEGNRKVGNVIEQQARLVNFLHHISEGKTSSEAADLVNKVLFDYSDLTQFEKGTMKRIVPFYTFMRKNVPYQLEQMFKHSDRYGKINVARKDIEKPETDEQKMYKPDYIDDNYVHLGNNKYKDFNLPVQDLEKLSSPKDMISSLNPLLKLGMELPTNKNIYFDSPIAKDERDKKEKYKNHILKSLVPVANRAGAIPGALDGVKEDKKKLLSWLTGFKVEEPDYKKAKEMAKKKYLEKLKEEETYQWKKGNIKEKKKNPLGQW